MRVRDIHCRCHSDSLSLQSSIWPWGLSTKQKGKQQVAACANSSCEMPPLPSLSILLHKSPPDAFRSMTSHVKKRKIKINTKMGYQFQPSSKNQSRPHHLCTFKKKCIPVSASHRSHSNHATSIPRLCDFHMTPTDTKRHQAGAHGRACLGVKRHNTPSKARRKIWKIFLAIQKQRVQPEEVHHIGHTQYKRIFCQLVPSYFPPPGAGHVFSGQERILLLGGSRRMPQQSVRVELEKKCH